MCGATLRCRPCVVIEAEGSASIGGFRASRDACGSLKTTTAQRAITNAVNIVALNHGRGSASTVEANAATGRMRGDIGVTFRCDSRHFDLETLLGRSAFRQPKSRKATFLLGAGNVASGHSVGGNLTLIG